MSDLKRLKAVLRAIGPAGIAVSGGIDSLTLATAAHRLAGADVSMHHATSPAVPAEETERTRALAAAEGWSLDVFDAGEFDNIVWGTASEIDGDNIVWGTASDGEGDNIVWGTSDALDEPPTLFDDPVIPPDLDFDSLFGGSEPETVVVPDAPLAEESTIPVLDPVTTVVGGGF